MTRAKIDASRSVGRWLAALLIATACLLFFRLGVLPVRNVPERRCWAVMQSMVESGDWWIPRVRGNPRILKPPLTTGRPSRPRGSRAR